MADTNDNPSVSPTATVTKRPRVRDAFVTGTIQVVDSGCKTLNAVAGIVSGVATRVTLHNAGVFLDLVEDQNGDQTKVITAVNTVLQIGKSV